MLEVLIVLAILGIVVLIAADSFRGMGEKYRVEGEAKQMYADLMDARGRAMQRSRATFVRFTGTGYRTVEDTFPAPDGTGTLTAADTPITSVTVRHAITAALPGDLDFRRDGTATVTGHIRLSSSARPDYDCVGIGITRLYLGKYNGTNACIEK